MANPKERCVQIRASGHQNGQHPGQPIGQKSGDILLDAMTSHLPSGWCGRADLACLLNVDRVRSLATDTCGARSMGGVPLWPMSP
jgi:hypothetical protein